VVFGPHPRSYVQALPRKMRRLAARSVLSSKLAAGQIIFVESYTDLEPRTKAMVGLLSRLNVTSKKVLVMTNASEANVSQAAGNLEHVTLMQAHFLNLVEMLKAEVLVINRAGVEVIEGILGQSGGRNSHLLTAGESDLSDGFGESIEIPTSTGQTFGGADTVQYAPATTTETGEEV
jgi:hypothetical protein